MASSKTLFFACLLVAAVAVPMAQATIPIVLPPIVLPPVSPLLPQITSVNRVQGILFCTVNGTVNPGSGLLTPRFPNATVELRCGPANTTVASVTTNSLGQFSILLDPLFRNVTQILTGCRLVVTTPLASCNATLSPTGTLTSTLQSLGTTFSGLFPITNIVPLEFKAAANATVSV